MTMKKKASEGAIYRYAQHLALKVSRRGNEITLRERYGKKRMIGVGVFKSFTAVKRAIVKYHDEELAKLSVGRS